MTAYLIQGGIVGITRADADGTPRILARLGTGRVFGEMALLRNGPRSVTALVLEQAVCEVVSRERFDALMHAAPPLIRHLIEAYVRQIESQTPEDLHRLPAVDHP
jgi:CRP-like cAMP-binding protein